MSHMYALPDGAAARRPPLRDRVAAEVRAWRARLNVSQVEVGRILGLSQGQVSARLLGKVEFSLTEIELLAAAWGIGERELIDGPATHGGPPPGIPVTDGDRNRQSEGSGLDGSNGSVMHRYPVWSARWVA